MRNRILLLWRMNWRQIFRNAGPSVFPCALVIAVGITWLLMTRLIDVSKLKEKIVAISVVYSVEASLLLILIGVVVSYATIKELFGSIPKQVFLWLAVIVLSSFILVRFVVYKEPRILFDEQIYLSIAQNTIFTGHASMCTHGDAEFGEYKCFWQNYNKQPPAHPVYIAQFFKIFGVSEDTGYLATNLTIIFSVISMFGGVYLFFGSYLTALFAAMFYGFTPQVLLWSNSVASEPLATAACIMGFFATALYIKKPRWETLLFLIGAVTLGPQTRFECFIIPILSLLLIILHNPREIKGPRLQWGISIVILIFLPLYLQMYVFKENPWGAHGGPRFGVEYFWKNVLVNGFFYFNNAKFPILFSIFFLLGIWVPGNRKLKIPLLIWLGFTWGVFLFFYAGSYSYGLDIRYSLLSAPPIAVFAGIGLTAFLNLSFFKSKKKQVWILCFSLLFLTWIRFLPSLRAYMNQAVHAKLDVEYARQFKEIVPMGSLVFTHNPNIWFVWQKNAAQTHLVMSGANNFSYFFKKYTGGLYFFENYWCHEGHQSDSKRWCDMMKEKFDLVELKSFFYDSYKYALYRMYPKGESPVPVIVFKDTNDPFNYFGTPAVSVESSSLQSK